MIVKIKKVHPKAILPTKGTEGAACLDAYSVMDYIMYPSQTRIVNLGIQVEVPSGYELQVRARSGLASKGIMVANGVGCIDSDYRGNVGVILFNSTACNFSVKAGDRVCQLKLSAVPEIEWEEVYEVSETERSQGGFGSTGA